MRIKMLQMMLPLGALALSTMTASCSKASAHRPYENFTWSPEPYQTPIDHIFPLRRPFTERLDKEEQSMAMLVVAKTVKADVKWLRFAFPTGSTMGRRAFVIFSIANGEQQVYKQLNSASCNAGYEPQDNVSVATTMCLP